MTPAYSLPLLSGNCRNHSYADRSNAEVLMRGSLIALVIGAVVLIGGFFALVMIGSGMEPQTEEVRVDVTEDLSR
ncbi:hypothetical protein [Hyphobacterium sp.]|uniref:hypothetical protein n=1 Tax=Hyphobacterium sp. TaxID=2004662 RepID=UPI003BAC776A